MDHFKKLAVGALIVFGAFYGINWIFTNSYDRLLLKVVLGVSSILFSYAIGSAIFLMRER